MAWRAGALSGLGLTWIGQSGVGRTGLTLDPNTGDYVGGDTISVSHNDEVELTVLRYDIDDTTFDVNSDGRFNSADVSALTAMLGGSAGTFDTNGNGIVDSDDVDMYSELIAAGAGSGIFADYNQDGIIDCHDLLSSSAFVYQVGDAGYHVELDYDLDGKIDSFDYAHFILGVPSADFNNDGDFGTDQDITDFFAALGGSPCAACTTTDINGDGDVGTDADISAFFSLLTSGCT